jgi:hypothetical protein
MGKAILARQRANGLIGQGRINKLYDEGKLVVLFADEYERLTARVAALERENATPRQIATDSTRANAVAAQVLQEAMGR